MAGKLFELAVRPALPTRFARLSELAHDLYYTWDRDVRRLFYRLDLECWEACGHNPKVFLRRVGQQALDEASRDLIYAQDYTRVLSAYDTYLKDDIPGSASATLPPDSELVAYFCAEYGFHESVPIYSGGLGILAGDYCKEISDQSVPFVAVGLLYREGYFRQRIGSDGNQVAEYPHMRPEDLPVTPVLDAAGQEIHVTVRLAGRPLSIKIWHAKAGHTSLYLLDSDVAENSEHDRHITRQLYGGDNEMRIAQEIVLGIGGVRALRVLDLHPTVWHINEGHAAFQILERCRERVAANMDFDSALSLVAAGTVFTSHTPVAAGHDVFDHQLVVSHFDPFIAELDIDRPRFFELGATPGNPQGFNMTALALRGSRFHNGVSRINGRVAAEMNAHIWPQIPARESPFSYVTNGVHVPTFLGRAWVSLFDMYFGSGWRNKLDDASFWERVVEQIPSHVFQSAHQVLKVEMIMDVRQRLEQAMIRNGRNRAQIARSFRLLDPEDTGVLTIGFARRFATYKRATLLFADYARLARLLNNDQRPVVILFAGKAHPSDVPGQQFVAEIYQHCQRPELEGKVFLLEDYNLAMSRKLLPGVDVWLNTPEYPMEACGTSGMKAAINGVPNLSVLDGWWAESFDGSNGWAIASHETSPDPGARYRAEATELLDALEYQVIPTYYSGGGRCESEAWVSLCKSAMKSVLPRFSATRMVNDYAEHYYAPAARHRRALMADDGAGARALAAWKREVIARWAGVSLRLVSAPAPDATYGDAMGIAVGVQLDGLGVEDVVVECVLGTRNSLGKFTPGSTLTLAAEAGGGGEMIYRGDFYQADSELLKHGPQLYQIRAYPHHPLLAHRFECGLMKWL